jgi:hypothetical protein
VDLTIVYLRLAIPGRCASQMTHVRLMVLNENNTTKIRVNGRSEEFLRLTVARLSFLQAPRIPLRIQKDTLTT